MTWLLCVLVGMGAMLLNDENEGELELWEMEAALGTNSLAPGLTELCNKNQSINRDTLERRILNSKRDQTTLHYISQAMKKSFK